MGFRFVVLSIVLLAACRPALPAEHARGISLVDDLGRPVRLAQPARRVVSLIPSATETIVALGARDRLVARTRYDRDPSLAALPSFGSGRTPSVEALVTVRPDLVVVSATDPQVDVESKLAAAGIATLALAVQDTADAFRAMRLLGAALGRDAQAAALVDSLRRDLAVTAASVAGRPRPRVFYVVFHHPPMTAGPRTFIAQLLDLAGGDNIFSDARTNWPTVSLEEVVRRDPDLVVLPFGPMFDRTWSNLHRRPEWRQLRAIREGRLVYVDADLATRPGPRLGEAARALRDALRRAEARR